MPIEETPINQGFQPYQFVAKTKIATAVKRVWTKIIMWSCFLTVPEQRKPPGRVRTARRSIALA